ncbi:MAG: NlpC/P60 family protein [Patescibacteria group bacterium]
MGKILIYESYLKMIKNSIGTKMFRNLYLEKNGKKLDATENGDLSCAYFVSNILLIWGLISEGHATIKSTIRDMKKNGWREISLKKIRPGDVIVWEERKSTKNRIRSHIGFYIGNKKTISHSGGMKAISCHHWTYNNKRKITAVYRWSKF